MMTVTQVRCFGLVLAVACLDLHSTCVQAQPVKGPVVPALPQHLPRQAGAEINPTGSPIAGGPGYHGPRWSTVADFVVTSPQELVDALSIAQAGNVVFVPGTAMIDMGDEVEIVIPQGVTLAGDRGINGSAGGQIWRTSIDPGDGTVPLFRAGGPAVRISGLQLYGPEWSTNSDLRANLFFTDYPDTEVDNNEIAGWNHTAIRSGDFGHLREQAFVHVHHNSIHHCRGAGYGYGVGIAGGHALIEANFFDYYRHAISSSGYRGSGYHARYNIVGANAFVFTNGDVVYPFDCHDSDGKNGDENLAGDYLIIHHNSFFGLYERYGAIHIEGVPAEPDSSFVYGNWSMQSEGELVQWRDGVNGDDEFITEPEQLQNLKVFANRHTMVEWPLTNASETRMREADFTGDGLFDMITFGFDANNSFNVWVGLTEGGYEPTTVWGSNGAYMPDRYRIGDADGDGYSDVISFEPNGNVYVWRSVPGQSAFAEPRLWFSTNDTGGSMRWIRD